MALKERYARLVAWQWANVSLPTDIIRIFLGAVLLIRGVYLLIDPSSIAVFLDETNMPGMLPLITFGHVIGGLLMTLGLLTRLGALLQIPILTGAVFVVHLREGLVSADQSLELSALVLFLLLVIFAFGPGKRSLDYKIFGGMFANASE